MIIYVGIILVTIITLTLTIAVSLYKEDNDYEIFSKNFILTAISVIGVFLISLVFIGGLDTSMEYYTINDKIEFKTKQNEEIANEITGYTNMFMKHEVDYKPKDINIIIKYPELKANTLVSKQIDIYVKNKEEVSKLEMRKIDLKVENKFWGVY